METTTDRLPDGWTEEAIPSIRSQQLGLRILHGPDGQRLLKTMATPWVLADPHGATAKTLDWDLTKSLRKVDRIYLAQALAHAKNDLFVATMGDPLPPITRAEAHRDQILADIAFMGFDVETLTKFDDKTGWWVVA